MPLRVKCPNPKCGKPLVIPDAARGKRIKCPACGTALAVPQAQQPGNAAQSVRCPSCLADLPANAAICTNCGFNLKTGGRAQVSVGPGPGGRRSGVSPLAPLGAFLTSNAIWLLLAAVAAGVAGYFLFLRKPPTQAGGGATSVSTSTPVGGQGPAGTGAPNGTGQTQAPPPPPPLVEDWPTELAPPFCKAIARWEKLDEPIVERYLERLRGIFRGSFRLMEFDKAGWKFDISLPEQPEPRPGYVFARVQGEVRLALEPVRPGGTTKIVPLPPQGLFLPWYYIFPYAKGARVVRQGLTAATFEFSKDGGKVAFGGQELEIPPGAVPDGTQVTLHYPYEDPKNPSGAKSLLHCIKVDVEPAAVVFSRPATLRLVSARLPGAARAFQAHVARRGAKLSAPEGIAAILPGGPVIWAPANEPGKVYGWDPARGIVMGRGRPEPGWLSVPFGRSALEAEARLMGRDQDVGRFVGREAQVTPTVVGPYGGVIVNTVPGPELKQTLEGALKDKRPVALRICSEDSSGQTGSRTVELTTAMADSDACGDLLRARFARSGVYTIRGSDGGVQVASAVYGPPYIVATLACRPPSGPAGVTVDIAAQIHEVALECMLYRLGEAQVAVGVSLSVPKPGTYSVAIESDEAGAAKAQP